MAHSMKRLLLITIVAVSLWSPVTVSADTLSSTATVSVVVPVQPLSALIEDECEFVVGPKTNKTFCTLTLVVAQPTVHNSGWVASLSYARIGCSCGHTLTPRALVVADSEDVVVINGQSVDQKSGPKLVANSISPSGKASQPFFRAKGDFGNGAYSVTVTLRLDVPAHTPQGTYIPVWSIKLIDADL
jgi:hypothetical protein